MIRIVLAALLSLLVLGLQQEALVHEFQHDAARLADRKVTLSPQTSATCATCALIAGGAHGLVAYVAAMQVATALDVVAPMHVGRSAHDTPRYYSTRAPPVLA